MKKTAVVNSKSFGIYFPEHIKKLEELGGVDVLDIDVNLSSVEIAKSLQDYECIIASVTPDFDREFFENSPKLKLIARHGLGYNSVDIEAATDHDVIVTKVEGIVEQEAVAEHVLALTMSLARFIPQADDSLRTQPWSNRSQYCGIELKNQKVGVIGYGNIGARVGEIFHNGFNAEVLVYDPYKSEEYIAEHKGVKVDLETLLSQSSVISINASANEDNFEMIGKDQFKQMKSEVRIVNTARGILIQEAALIEALETKMINGYAADVFVNEPVEKNHQLLTFSNVVTTPHIGAYTYPSLKGMGDKVVSDVEAVLKGELPKEIVNKRG